MSLPWTKFFPADWLADDGLRSVSLAARGLWIDMVCLMLRSPKRGYLLNPDGKPMPPETIARRIGAETTEVRMALTELQSAQVFSLERGAIYSRRIVRETAQREGTQRRVDKHRNADCNARGNGVGNARGNGQMKRPEARGQRLDAQTKMNDAEKTAAAPLAVSDAKPSLPAVPDGCWGKPFHGILFDPKAVAFLWVRGERAEHVDRWRAAYPATDPEQEIRRAAEWCAANPAKGRKSNYRKFLTDWMSRTQDRGGSRAGHHPQVVQSKADERRAAKAATEYPEPEYPLPILKIGGTR